MASDTVETSAPSPTTSSSSAPEDAERRFSSAIEDLALKWGSKSETPALIRSSCLSRDPQWLQDLLTLQRLLVAVVFTIITPIFFAYLCIFFNAGFHFPSFVQAILDDNACLIDVPLPIVEMARPVAHCETVCVGMASVPVIDGTELTRDRFRRDFAYTGRPLLVKNATRDWTAKDEFGFPFFKRLFLPLVVAKDNGSETETEGGGDHTCQFFPYSTSFQDLIQFFNMSEARAKLEPGEKSWYVGWSNCFPSAVSQLRRHYRRPAFLPEDSEASRVDWIFMGGSGGGGGGAPVHIDHVDRPSWQALISGSKTWVLHPPPECESVCSPELLVHLDAGDIFVIDTNLWFHGTRVPPGLITISIGSEFD